MKMTIQNLIDRLTEVVTHGADPDDIVLAFDGDIGKCMPVTGFTYGSSEVRLFTDTDEEE